MDMSLTAVLAFVLSVLSAEPRQEPRLGIVIFPAPNEAAAALIPGLREAIRQHPRLELVLRPPEVAPADLRPARVGVLFRGGDDAGVDIVAVDMETGNTIWSEHVAGADANATGAVRRLADSVAVRVRATRRPVRRGSALPAAAVMAYGRAILQLDRGDTAAAAQLLVTAIQHAPGWAPPCVELRRVRPLSAVAASCRPERHSSTPIR